jgi:glycosyltransferase involved in cell wall biosynthesis
LRGEGALNKLTIHLSIVVPIHAIPIGDGLSALARWTSKIPENCELIFTLDADDKNRELRNWCETYITSPKKIVQRRSGNPGGSRNVGMEVATGEWLAFVDSDDSFQFSQALRMIKQHGASSDLIVCRYQTFYQNKDFVKRSPRICKLNQLSLDLGFWRCIYRMEFASKVAFPNLRMAEDQIYFSRFLSLNPRIEFGDEVIYEYTVGISTQLTKSSEAKEDLKFAISILREEMETSETQKQVRIQILLRQYFSLLQSLNFNESFSHFIKLMLLISKPQVLRSLLSLGVLFFQSIIKCSNLDK